MTAIRDHLGDQQFDAETERVMGVAFEMTWVALGYGDGHTTPETIAAKILELTKAGERDPNRLCDLTLNYCRALARG